MAFLAFSVYFCLCSACRACLNASLRSLGFRVSTKMDMSSGRPLMEASKAQSITGFIIMALSLVCPYLPVYDGYLLARQPRERLQLEERFGNYLRPPKCVYFNQVCRFLTKLLFRTANGQKQRSVFYSLEFLPGVRSS